MTNIQFYQTERVPTNLTRPKDTLYCDIINQLNLLAEHNEHLQEDKTNGNIFASTQAIITQQEIRTYLQRLNANLDSP